MERVKKNGPPVPLSRTEVETLNKKEREVWREALEKKRVMARRFYLAKRKRGL